MRYAYAWLLIIFSWLLAACGGATPTASPNGTDSQGLILTSSPAPPGSALAEFRILSPQDEAVVNVPEVEVVGEAKPDTVITLNDEIVVVDQSGTFSVTLALEEGPNEIEVVASDPEGNEVSFELEVTYDPES
jgi:hypothetical protein